MANPVDLSIAIPAWNEAESLNETLDRISDALHANEAHGLTSEIIVCDNASTDKTSEIARAAGAHVVFEPERGIARARNTGDFSDVYVRSCRSVLASTSTSWPRAS